ncbi:MAG: aldehyde ferredoxin oxidoreductase family protein [Mycobacterium leprae]
MNTAYTGQILWVDLTERRWWTEQLPEETYRRFLGGYGLGIKVLFDRMAPGVDPLGPDNVLGFIPGLLTGIGTPFSGRFMVVGKSPLTGGWGDANCGGYFGPELKRSGYDALFVVGQASEPVYLWLNRGEVEIRSASHLWGKDALEAERLLKAEHGGQAAVIGQSGERLSLISGIVNDRGRIAARSGLGAVMGSKQLKAVVCKAHLPAPKADMEAFKESARFISDPVRAALAPKPWQDKLMRYVQPLLAKLAGHVALPGGAAGNSTILRLWGEQGTTSTTDLSAQSGDSPVRNWTGAGVTDFPYQRAARLSDHNAIQYNTKSYGCSACPLHCGAIIHVEKSPYTPLPEGHRPEYEALAALGSNILCDDLEAAIEGNERCNRYGLDVISAGATVAWAIESFERGLITREMTDGVELRWGNPEAMLYLIDIMGERRGPLGDLLADGVKRAAERLGHGSDAWAVHVGGQELPMHDPRSTPSYGTTYVADPTPGRHTAGTLAMVETGFAHPLFGNLPQYPVKRYQYTGKGPLHAQHSNAWQVGTNLGLCQFSQFVGALPYVQMLKAGTGWTVSEAELLQTGERIQNLRQCFNVREGLTPADFQLPKRLLEPTAKGPNAHVHLDMDALRADYFQAMDWDLLDGRPSAAKLKELGLTEALQSLYAEESAG